MGSSLWHTGSLFLVAAYRLPSSSMRTLSCGMHAGSSSPTRDQTWAPCIGSAESYSVDHQGSPWTMCFKMSKPMTINQSPTFVLIAGVVYMVSLLEKFVWFIDFVITNNWTASEISLSVTPFTNILLPFQLTYMTIPIPTILWLHQDL